MAPRSDRTSRTGTAAQAIKGPNASRSFACSLCSSKSRPATTPPASEDRHTICSKGHMPTPKPNALYSFTSPMPIKGMRIAGSSAARILEERDAALRNGAAARIANIYLFGIVKLRRSSLEISKSHTKVHSSASTLIISMQQPVKGDRRLVAACVSSLRHTHTADVRLILKDLRPDSTRRVSSCPDLSASGLCIEDHPAIHGVQ